jgi:hypothetical protein
LQCHLPLHKAYRRFLLSYPSLILLSMFWFALQTIITQVIF